MPVPQQLPAVLPTALSPLGYTLFHEIVVCPTPHLHATPRHENSPPSSLTMCSRLLLFDVIFRFNGRAGDALLALLSACPSSFPAISFGVVLFF